MRKLLLTAGLLCVLLMGQAQQDSIRKFGIGVELDNFILFDLLSNGSLIPSNNIIFTYNFNSKYRIEPVFGFIKYNDDHYQINGYHLGLGNYLLLRKEKTVFQLGLKAGLDDLFIENRYSNSWLSGNLQERETRLSIGPFIGGEYFLGKHFSIAAEVGLLYFNSTLKDNEDTYDTEDIKTSYFITDTGIILRFYF
jgi:hypothetical protein